MNVPTFLGQQFHNTSLQDCLLRVFTCLVNQIIIVSVRLKSQQINDVDIVESSVVVVQSITSEKKKGKGNIRII